MHLRVCQLNSSQLLCPLGNLISFYFSLIFGQSRLQPWAIGIPWRLPCLDFFIVFRKQPIWILRLNQSLKGGYRKFFLFQNFLNPSYCCPKLGQISRIFFAKLRCQKKKTRLHFFVSRLHMNRTWVSHGTFEVLFMAEVKTKNCSRVFFL